MGRDELSFDLAEDLVPDILEEIGIDEDSDVGETAMELARRHGGVEGGSIARAPSSIAASSVYFASLYNNRKVTQRAVAAASGKSVVTIRKVYKEIAEREGVEIAGPSDDAVSPTPDRLPSWVQKVAGIIRGGS